MDLRPFKALGLRLTIHALTGRPLTGDGSKQQILGAQGNTIPIP